MLPKMIAYLTIEVILVFLGAMGLALPLSGFFVDGNLLITSVVLIGAIICLIVARKVGMYARKLAN